MKGIDKEHITITDKIIKMKQTYIRHAQLHGSGSTFRFSTILISPLDCVRKPMLLLAL